MNKRSDVDRYARYNEHRAAHWATLPRSRSKRPGAPSGEAIGKQLSAIAEEVLSLATPRGDDQTRSLQVTLHNRLRRLARKAK